MNNFILIESKRAYKDFRKFISIHCCPSSCGYVRVAPKSLGILNAKVVGNYFKEEQTKRKIFIELASDVDHAMLENYMSMRKEARNVIRKKIKTKEKQLKEEFTITIRNRQHFNKVISWLNENVGRGNNNWAGGNNILKKIKVGEEAKMKIRIYADSYPEETAAVVTLL